MSKAPPPKSTLSDLMSGTTQPQAGLDSKAAFQQAVGLHQSGQLQQAESLYRQILSIDPDHVDALGLLGVLANQIGRPADALPLLDRAISMAKRNPVFHMHRGMTLFALGQAGGGLESLKKAAKFDPKNSDVHFNLGLGQQKAGFRTDAVRSLKKAARLGPKNPQIHMSLGNALAQNQQFKEAIGPLRKAVALAPNLHQARHFLIQALLEAEQLADAEQEARDALTSDPADGQAHRMLGQALNKQEKFQEALPLLEQTAMMQPDNAETALDLGNALRGLQRFDEALAVYERILEQYPYNAGLNYNKGQVHMEEGELALALDAFETTIAADADFVQAHVQKAALLFLTGRYGEAFPEWAWRWRYSAEERPFPQAKWAGDSLKDKTILIWGEQGIGDELIYFSLIPAVQAMNPQRVLVECDPRLQRLLAMGLTGTEVIARTDKPSKDLLSDQIDYQIPCGDLLTLLPEWPKKIVRTEKYLAADAANIASCGTWLNGLGDGPKIGISWRSGRAHLGRMKSAPLDLWGPILDQNDNVFVNLQYGDTEAEITAAGATVWTNPNIDRFNDMDGLAALIQSLDLVITTSNVTAHIAAALGKPCWLIAARTPIWYWGFDGSEPLFYRSVRVYRQKQAGDWQPVIDEISNDLKAL